MSDRDRFLAKTERRGACLIWTAATFARGYGAFKVDGETRRAHRFAYELEYGEIPEGAVLDHSCGARLCVEPTHLRPVSNRENVQYRTGLNRNNTSGHRGVYWSKTKGKWVAEVKVNRKKKTRSFATAMEANEWAEATRRESYPLGEFGDQLRVGATA